jgi:DNA-directed RNA polymerase specialized sigma24 family protein
MDNPMHVAVVRAAYWEDLESKVIAEQHDTTAANVDQIKKRFRESLRAECERRGISP